MLPRRHRRNCPPAGGCAAQGSGGLPASIVLGQRVSSTLAILLAPVHSTGLLSIDGTIPPTSIDADSHSSDDDTAIGDGVAVRFGANLDVAEKTRRVLGRNGIDVE